MENLKTVSALVKNILEHDHKARNTDNHLYLMVLEHYSGLRGIDIHAMTVPVFLKELDPDADYVDDDEDYGYDPEFEDDDADSSVDEDDNEPV